MSIEASYRRVTLQEFARLQDDAKAAESFFGTSLEDLDNPEKFLARMQEQESSDRYLGIGTDWHALHFLLTGDGELKPHVNHGALFGLFRDQKTYANMGFALISLLAAVGIIAWSCHGGTSRDAWLMASLGLILAGTLGNLYDRVLFNGVRDFLHWHYGFDWPVFNVADCCLVAGAGMLLLQVSCRSAEKVACRGRIQKIFGPSGCARSDAVIACKVRCVFPEPLLPMTNCTAMMNL